MGVLTSTYVPRKFTVASHIPVCVCVCVNKSEGSFCMGQTISYGVSSLRQRAADAKLLSPSVIGSSVRVCGIELMRNATSWEK